MAAQGKCFSIIIFQAFVWLLLATCLVSGIEITLTENSFWFSEQLSWSHRLTLSCLKLEATLMPHAIALLVYFLFYTFTTLFWTIFSNSFTCFYFFFLLSFVTPFSKAEYMSLCTLYFVTFIVKFPFNEVWSLHL